MKWLFARLAEPSTHAAIAGLLGIAGQLAPPPYGTACLALADLFGAAGVAVKEKAA